MRARQPSRGGSRAGGGGGKDIEDGWEAASDPTPTPPPAGNRALAGYDLTTLAADIVREHAAAEETRR